MLFLYHAFLSFIFGIDCSYFFRLAKESSQHESILPREGMAGDLLSGLTGVSEMTWSRMDTMMKQW